MTFPYVNPVLLGGVRGALFVNLTTYYGADGSFAWPTGAAPGDYAIICTFYPSSDPRSGYSHTFRADAATFTGININHKRLTAADLAGAPPAVGVGKNYGTAFLAVYRGPTAAVVRSTAESTTTATTLDIPGFAKATNCRGIVNVVVDAGASGTAIGTKPSYMTLRSSNTVGISYCSAIADVLDKRNYTDSTDFAWTGFSTSNSRAQVGASIELL